MSVLGLLSVYVQAGKGRQRAEQVCCIAHGVLDRAPCQIDGGHSQVGRRLSSAYRIGEHQ
jgi:hypothetical protein